MSPSTPAPYLWRRFVQNGRPAASKLGGRKADELTASGELRVVKIGRSIQIEPPVPRELIARHSS